MPELPEVETTVRGIAERFSGALIKSVWTDYRSAARAGKEEIKDPRYFARFKRAVEGTRVEGARRRGKHVIIDLSTGASILVHMKMTGHFLSGRYRFDRKKGEWLPAPGERAALRDPFNRFIHLVFDFGARGQLAFSDMRKFATVSLASHADALAGRLPELGPEPLEQGFTARRLSERLSMRPKAPIKQALMDQRIVAGVGNIYSDEILWDAGVHPLSKAGKIPADRVAAMRRAMQRILRRSIKLGGDSMSDFRNLEGEKGGFHPYHNAYFRHGEPCSRCGAEIRKTRIGGRSAHFCPKHQRLYR